MHKFKLHFDGGAKPNPGQGYGSYELVKVNKLAVPASLSPLGHVEWNYKNTLIQFGFMTNNMAEYHAMIHGIKKLWHEAQHGYLNQCGIVTTKITLNIYSDSTILVNQMNNNHRSKVVHLMELRDEAQHLLKSFGHWKCVWNSRWNNVQRFGH